VTPERLVRKIFQMTGCEVQVLADHDSRYNLHANDSQSGESFVSMGITKSRLPQALRDMHESIYRARCRRKYELQGGRCAKCGRDLQGCGEGHHIQHRSKGRDDRISNLAVLCTGFAGACHREEHGG